MKNEQTLQGELSKIGITATTHDAAGLPFILTDDEANNAVVKAVKDKLKHRRWRGLPDPELSVDADMDEILRALKIDREVVILQANSLKHCRIMDMENERRRQREFEEYMINLRRQWGSKEMYRYLQEVSLKFGKKFKIDEGNKVAIKALCYQLSENYELSKKINLGENKGYFDPSKGIMIRGDFGCGKTYPVKCLSKNALHPIQLFSVPQLAKEAQKSGFETLLIKENSFILIDDVGAEQDGLRFYGSPVNWFREFILDYYFNNNPFFKLIITTNLTWQEISEMYGQDVRSRMAEMFNDIVMTGDDRRKEKK